MQSDRYSFLVCRFVVALRRRSFAKKKPAVSPDEKIVYCLGMTAGFRDTVFIGLIDTASRGLTKPELRSTSYDLLKRMAIMLAGVPEEETRTTVAPSGKPYFSLHPELQFSLSHNGPLAACALGSCAMGVDIEVTAEGRHWREIAGRFFAEGEVAFLERQGAAAPDAFYHLWTRKEAWLKAQGLPIWRIGRASTASYDRSTGLSCRTWQGIGSARFSLSLSVKKWADAMRVEFPARFNSEAVLITEVPEHFFPPAPDD
jgi:hypothetical protein